MKRTLLLLSTGLSILGVILAISAARAMPVRTSVGDHGLRTLVTGRGAPSVVLETFGPAYLETWNRIQPGISKFATVFSYDHAGYWVSEPGPKPRDAKQIARELHTALNSANVAPPYLLVGYSFGGPYIRVFADLYPNEVTGMVFVDPAQEEFMASLTRRFPNMNVVTDADRQKQDEWGCQWPSMNQAHEAHLPNVPIILISAAQNRGPLTRRLLPEWLGAHRQWLSQYPNTRHLITTNSGHGLVFTEPQLIIAAVKAMVEQNALETRKTDHVNLEAFSGVYQAGPDTMVKVRAASDHLTLQVANGGAMEFIPQTEGAFLHKKTKTRIRFLKDARGVVAELILIRDGEHRAPRVSDRPDPDQIQSLAVGSKTYRVMASGEGPTVVLLGNIDKWTKVKAGIGAGARVIAFEALTNESKSEGAGTRTVEEQVTEIHRVLNTIPAKPPYLLVGPWRASMRTRIPTPSPDWFWLTPFMRILPIGCGSINRPTINSSGRNASINTFQIGRAC